MALFKLLILFSSLYCSYARSIRSVENVQPSYEENLDAIIKNLTDCFNNTLEPLLSQLSNMEQNDIRNIALSGIDSYVHDVASYINSFNKTADNGIDEESDYDLYDENFITDIVSNIEIIDVIDPTSDEDESSLPTNSAEANSDSTATATSTATAESIAKAEGTATAGSTETDDDSTAIPESTATAEGTETAGSTEADDSTAAAESASLSS